MKSLENTIRECVDKIGDPLMMHITAYCGDRGFFVDDMGFSVDVVKAEVKRMVDAGILRMKDDDIDHDWTYRKGRNW